eukprot:365087-Chlamydomonas_euryale.AAC.6
MPPLSYASTHPASPARSALKRRMSTTSASSTLTVFTSPNYTLDNHTELSQQRPNGHASSDWQGTKQDANLNHWFPTGLFKQPGRRAII